MSNYRWKDGLYDGFLRNGMPHGKGKLNNDGTYKGNFIHGKKNGEFRVTLKLGGGKYQHVYKYRDDVQL